ncbi:Membrane protein, putative [Shewanella piezotolerans WP3]|uniref:Membrane protein, putative n=1 Tax=Shewanella piezotolerans (strain WP3 / JCM 13877) TaxID=225849 RepID=B8CJ72_SHEPW|nr:MAPEG family protein [Shewanella piezotolerans]ACJ27834.1 Membrane protein, putative [Shewanella piezotolerans WP3]
MTTLLICLMIAMLLPYMAKGPVAVAMAKLGGYDNSHPREQQSKLTGFGARAVAGHQNAFESLLIFGLAVLVVIAAGKVNMVAEVAAIVHVIARMAYQVLYLKDKGTLRSLSWFVAIIASFTVFCQAF